MEINSQNFLFYGYTAAWIIVFGFVLLLVRRGQRLDKELARLKALVDDRVK